MMRYGLIGEKLGHSFSKIIHEKLADYTYDLIPLSLEELDVFMREKEFSAINVTIPESCENGCSQHCCAAKWETFRI